jgi:hypothetical protein
MDGASVRKSQQVVKFNRLGTGWDIHASSDENSSPPHALAIPRRPTPLTVEPDEIIQPTPSVFSPKISTSKNIPRRVPFRTVDANCNVCVLCQEIKRLEEQLAAERRARVAANKLLSGFCDYYKNN